MRWTCVWNFPSEIVQDLASGAGHRFRLVVEDASGTDVLRQLRLADISKILNRPILARRSQLHIAFWRRCTVLRLSSTSSAATAIPRVQPF